jgi:toluene monooxygenase system ferredoxin subunit
MMDETPDLLRGLSQEEVEQALSLGTRITIASGGELFNLGEPADRLYIIERGRIRLTLPMQVRKREESILVEERAPGQTIGWSALIPPYRFTLKATAPLQTDVIALTREALNEFFAANPSAGCAVAVNLASVIGQRLQLFQAMWLREMQRVVEAHCV